MASLYRNIQIYYLRKEDIEKFFNYLYKDSTVYLKRKYNTFGNTLYK